MHSHKPIVIRPQRQGLADSLQELWEYRDLLWLLTVRQVSVRYKQTVIGVAWVLLQPLVAMVIFTVIFGYFAKLSSNGLPYPVFAYSALVLWNLFSEGLSRAGTSLIADEKLITKVYFPRLIIPLSAVGSAWIDFAVSLFVLFPLTFFYGLRPTWSLFLLPVAMILTMLLASRCGDDDGRAERALSRFSVHDSIFDAGLALCFACGLFQRNCPCPSAPVLLPQSDGGFN
jgi:lipopolysaccharide transport system permease protein